MSTFGANADLDDVIDASGFDVDDATPSQGGAACNKAGMYHVHIKDLKKEGSLEPDEKGNFKTPCIRLDLEILAGSNADQIGKVIYHRVYQAKAKRDENTGKTVGMLPLSDSSREQYFRTAFQLGVMDEADIGKEKAVVRWSQAQGRQAIVRVDHEEEDVMKDGKKNGEKRSVYRISWGNFWNVNHPDVADVPKDAEAMLLASGGGGGSVDVSDL